ncbi:MAG: glutaredoxin family protein [Nanohaloarchaea archaeon]|nr:glutaredoxin family protein [Candidatus Nanohaloarchaea archaeon]
MSKEIEVFTTPACPYCTKIKKWLDENGYDYTEHNVAENKEKAQEMIQETGERGVPQTFIGKETVVGFQPGKIQEAIEEEIET